ncbi:MULTISPECIES: flagellar biosynthesis anti-sigma factor FlgM [Burkholderia]|uniref:Negative regulator of flagellin synthesis n=1 Tax=Burkholderia savannae TaxID=1637837 RepID=A0ABR5TK35_9BURK|nr:MULTISPECIES: flagellar biosynthesis anti-sigma factor FlgM [Burkholderia]AOJ70316.1 flagellar biosynthesis anti-sigma factor FlgM [Burkholderia savannae]AOJ82277.1 flagellar biosynthesis anti-sigma factor FlgM [Burkholderia savannae]AOK48422.1 flagellar biosynthesis anti-sigma factor FlgM [Burkholderia sp. MSMB617WGS]KGS01618.1 flagellar biosynthesis anti-sigma factor FlgM [Burkholderia sp. ABCPW 111]KVG38756.1 flagellar biosynthesis anti-sigma factor FlgM [Burkholderia sp. MSMB0265]
MKVDSTTTSNARTLSNASAGTARTQAGQPAAAQAPAGAASAPTGGDANVSLSGLSSTLRGLAASGSADIDTAQVEAIRDAIKNGTLSIDTGKIADGILQTARDLLKQPPQTGNS